MRWRYHRMSAQKFAASANGRYAPPQPLGTWWAWFEGERKLPEKCRRTSRHCVRVEGLVFASCQGRPRYVLGRCFFFILFLVLTLMGSSEPSTRPGRSFIEALKLLPQVVGFLGGILAMIIAVASLRTRFFPLVSFTTGQSTRRHQIDEQIRWTVLVGFLVGLAGSVAYAALSWV